MNTEGQETAQDEASKKAEEEYEAGWGKDEDDEGNTGGTSLEAQDEEKDEGLSEEEKKPQQTSHAGKQEKKEETAQEGSVLKALKDTKSWATKLTEENKKLREKIEAYEKGHTTAGEVEAQRRVVQDSKDAFEGAKTKAYEDYPELKGVLDPLIDTVNVLKKENAELKKTREEDEKESQRDKAVEAFQRDIKPQVVKKHPDFDAVMQNEDYWLWAEAQRPALKVAAMNSRDPEDISWAIGEFKKFAASGEIDALKEKDAQKRKERIVNAMAIKGGHTSIPTGPKKGGEDDYDSGWEIGGKKAAHG